MRQNRDSVVAPIFHQGRQITASCSAAKRRCEAPGPEMGTAVNMVGACGAQFGDGLIVACNRYRASRLGFHDRR